MNTLTKATLFFICTLTLTACCGGTVETSATTEESTPESETPEPEDTAAKTPRKTGLSEGDAVVARWGSTSFYEGSVDSVSKKKITVAWASGGKNTEVDRKHVFPVPGKGSGPEVEEGDFVFAKWAGGTQWWGAEVLDTGGKIKVRYVSDASEGKVAPHELIKAPKDTVKALQTALANAQIVKGAKAAGGPFTPSGWSPKKGEEVVAQWAASTWYQGTIKSVSGDDLTITWKDKSTSKVKQSKAAPVPTDASPKATKGDYVLVAPKSATGFATWQYGKVKSAKGDKIEVKVQDGKKRKLSRLEYLTIQ